MSKNRELTEEERGRVYKITKQQKSKLLHEICGKVIVCDCSHSGNREKHIKPREMIKVKMRHWWLSGCVCITVILNNSREPICGFLCVAR